MILAPPRHPTLLASTSPTHSALETISGRMTCSRPSVLMITSSQDSVFRSIRPVREAFVTSTQCRRCPVSLYTSQQSTVPNMHRLDATASATAGQFSIIQSILYALKYVLMGSPVVPRNASTPPSRPDASLAHRSAVRSSFHTIALHSGLPVSLSQSTLVSRWLAMPSTISRSRDVASRVLMQPSTLDTTHDQISSGSCSTHPGRGYDCRNGVAWCLSFGGRG